MAPLGRAPSGRPKGLDIAIVKNEIVVRIRDQDCVPFAFRDAVYEGRGTNVSVIDKNIVTVPIAQNVLHPGIIECRIAR